MTHTDHLIRLAAIALTVAACFLLLAASAARAPRDASPTPAPDHAPEGDLS
jgi:hypothetical protein